MTATTLRDKIATTIDGSTETVQAEVVKYFVDIELKRRTKLIIDGLTKLSSAEAELATIKADVIVFDGEGKPIQQGWSTAQKGKRDRAQKLVDRITVALTPAIAEANFKPLEEVLKDSSGSKSSDNDDR
jgi:hypothetical protein